MPAETGIRLAAGRREGRGERVVERGCGQPTEGRYDKRSALGTRGLERRVSRE